MNRHARRAAAFAALVAALFATGCTPHAPAPKREPLPAVSALPAPPPQAPVASVAPVGAVDTLAQIRVTFSDDLIPLERLESPDETALLAHFSIAPALPGHFRFLTPRMIGFEADRAWPAATRVRVTIAKGLRDRHGHALAGDVSWTFQTDPIKLDDLPGRYEHDQTLDLAPKITFTSNVALDRASLEAHASLRRHGDGGPRIRLVVPPDTAKPSASPASTLPPNEEYDPAQSAWRYLLVPDTALAKGTRYDIAIEPGLVARDGNLPSDATFAGTFVTPAELRFVRVDRESGGRFADGNPRLRFSTPIDEKSLGALALSPPARRGTTPFAAMSTFVGINASLLEPNTDYSVTIGADLHDTYGQRLGTQERATFRTGDFAPDVWAPSGTCSSVTAGLRPWRAMSIWP